jgi:vitellogenic carboxypeptidase-like protein
VGNFSSYAGYFNTDEGAGNNMFWWYFPPQNGNTSAPTVLWLQGGPGGSSLFGMMVEMGPFRSGATPTTIDANPGSWNAEYGMLFIDNPVGAGYSYTTNAGSVRRLSMSS